MIRSVKDLLGVTVRCTDGDVGKIKDFFFDDDKWGIRYLVVSTGTWLSGRQVIISPRSISRLNWPGKRIDLSLKKEQVQKSPDIDTASPISRKRETEHSDYYGHPYYWGGLDLWGASALPGAAVPPPTAGIRNEPELAEVEEDNLMDEESHLRRAGEVIGYHIQARDGEIGHIQDLLVSDEDWGVHGIVVDTSNWFGGERLSISPYRISQFSWNEGKAHLDMDREEVRSSPEFHYSAARR